MTTTVYYHEASLEPHSLVITTINEEILENGEHVASSSSGTFNELMAHKILRDYKEQGIEVRHVSA